MRNPWRTPQTPMSPAAGRPKGAPAKPVLPQPASQDKLLTSKDLFGDMVDSVEDDDAPPEARPVARSGPIRVQVSEPSRGGTLRAKEEEEDAERMLPADVAALLDAAFEPVPTPASVPKPASPTTPKRATPARPSTLASDESLAEAPTGPVRGPLSSRHEVDESAVASLQALLRSSIAPATPAKGRGARERPAEHETPLFKAAAPRNAPSFEEDFDLADVVERAYKAADRPAGRSRKNAPQTFGPYVLLERVAIGGMAEVFRAKRTGVEGFEKVVAVKRILPHLSDNKEFVDMFIDEAKMVAGLTHPNIVQIFDLGKHRGAPTSSPWSTCTGATCVRSRSARASAACASRSTCPLLIIWARLRRPRLRAPQARRGRGGRC